MYIRFLKLNPHCALFILLQALYNSHSKKILPFIKKILFYPYPDAYFQIILKNYQNRRFNNRKPNEIKVSAEKKEMP